MSRRQNGRAPQGGAGLPGIARRRGSGLRLVGRRLAAIGLLGSLCLHAATTQAQLPAGQVPARPVRLALFAPLDISGPISYHIDASIADSAVHAGDEDLCHWALEDWADASGGRFDFVEVADEADALLRIRFVPPQYGQYGEMQPLDVDGRRGAAVYIRPDTEALGPDIAAEARADPLLRDTIVHLTCLHELGHALGLMHTDQFADIMFFFGFGGNIPLYFGRFRDQLETRDDIGHVSGLSAGDKAALRALYEFP
jgi:hypothetical protein